MPLGPRVLHLGIGELIVSEEPVVISTVLGSCVAVSLYCTRTVNGGAGGLIHYALPWAPERVAHADSFRYADHAIPGLIAELERMTGSDRRCFQAKITGGASSMEAAGSGFQAGPANIEAARVLLKQAGIPIVGEEIGGAQGRKVLFSTQNGRLQVARLNPKQNVSRLPTAPVTGLELKPVLAIGASTGGTEAIKSLLLALPPVIPPTLIVQHIPAHFATSFAQHLNELCAFEVKEAENGDEVKASRVLIAPGSKQMKVVKRESGLFVRITDDPPVNRHKPSVDYLFQSIAADIGSHSIGVLLTGMGDDGARGLLEMRAAGARTIGQDERSSVVYGMPKVAYEAGAVETVAPLRDIPGLILRFSRS